ncbi:hypothetical protein [Nonomuraea sp. NPDC001023]|uniref:hypothetical protein n=1 Tax=unclassified Nonomuraea TaxID=2593643 RepID=UPI0033261D7C
MTAAGEHWHSRQCVYGKTGDERDECHCRFPDDPPGIMLTCGHDADLGCSCYLNGYE